MPLFTTMSAENRLTVFLRSKGPTDREKGEPSEQVQSPAEPPQMGTRQGQEREKTPALQKLAQLVPEDGREDTARFTCL